MTEELRIEADITLVERLLGQQCPQFADLPLQRVVTSGVNNTLFRLGPKLSVRLPQSAWAAEHIRKEQEWLPVIRDGLHIEVPAVVFAGEPNGSFPWHWSVYSWLDGGDADTIPLGDEGLAGQQLAGFVKALQALDSTGGPLSGEHSGMRGLPLSVRDPVVQQALATIQDFDVTAASAAWEISKSIPNWDDRPVWIHGDIHPGNVLVRNGEITGILDWEMLSVGDPALDASGAWMLFGRTGRESFRAALQLDDDTWLRGRGWALCIGLIAAAYYHNTNPALASFSRKAAQAVVDDYLEGPYV